METDEFVLEFRDSSDEEEESVEKKRRFDQEEDCSDTSLLIMGPGFGNETLNFLNPDDEQKLKIPLCSSTNYSWLNDNATFVLKKPTYRYNMPRKRNSATSSLRHNLPSIVNKCAAEGPVIETVQSMHRNQLNSPTDRSSLFDDDASTVSSASNTSLSTPSTDDNIFPMLREGFETDKSQSSLFLYSNTLAMFANASASCQALETLDQSKARRPPRNVKHVAARKLRITLKDRMNAIRQRNRELRAENKVLVRQVGLLATELELELEVKLPPVLKEFPQIEEDIEDPKDLKKSIDENQDKSYDSPIRDDQTLPTVAPDLRRHGLCSTVQKLTAPNLQERIHRIANQNTDIFRTNESLQTLIDKLYELQNSKAI